MKKKYWIIIGLIALGIIAGIVISKKNNKKNTENDKDKYAQVETRDIQNDLLIAGKLSSSKEVSLKSDLAGIIDKLYVSIGDNVKKGQAIAKIRTLPDPKNSEDADRQINRANISLERVAADYKRNKLLYDQGVLSKVEYETSVQEYKLALEEVKSAKSNKRIVNQGFSNQSDFVSNVIYSTIDGLVLDIPIKVGGSIVNRNTFNEGTTVAVIADMSEILFAGKVNEKSLKYIELGKELKIKVNALTDGNFVSKVTKIAPKGIDEGGITKFDIEAKLDISPVDLYKIKSGYTATANMIIEESKNTTAIEEKYIQYSLDTAFVYIQKGDDKKKTALTTGISDGLYIEILKGLKKGDKIIKETEEQE